MMTNARMENDVPNNRDIKTIEPGEKPSKHDGFSPGSIVSISLLFGPSFSSLAFFQYCIFTFSEQYLSSDATAENVRSRTTDFPPSLVSSAVVSEILIDLRVFSNS